MYCLKRPGERVMARTFERQVVELHVRVALAQPLYAIRAACDRACSSRGVAASGVGAISTFFRLVQQGPDRCYWIWPVGWTSSACLIAPHSSSSDSCFSMTKLTPCCVQASRS